MFMATELLRATVGHYTTTGTAAHDLESFCWVFVFSLYIRAVRDALTVSERSALVRENRRIFAATSYQELLNNRAVALPEDLCEAFDTIQELKTYLDGAGEKRLIECLDTCWYLLKGVQPVRQRRLPTPRVNFATTMKDFPQTYTVTKATHKGLLRAFSAPKVDYGSEAGHEREV